MLQRRPGPRRVPRRDPRLGAQRRRQPVRDDARRRWSRHRSRAPPDASRAAAHFELANHLWRAGERDAAIRHFNECHRLQPDNWTYKRQAWSLVGNERVGGGELGRFTQGPLPGEEADWPFIGNFDADVAALRPGQYYPKTLEDGF